MKLQNHSNNEQLSVCFLEGQLFSLSVIQISISITTRHLYSGQHCWLFRPAFKKRTKSVRYSNGGLNRGSFNDCHLWTIWKPDQSIIQVPTLLWYCKETVSRTQTSQSKIIFCSINFIPWLWDYSILLKARHDELINENITSHNHELIQR